MTQHTSSRRWEDLVVVITGGSSGIGKQLAADFLARGCRVYVCTDKSDSLYSVKEEFAVYGDRFDARDCDVRDTAAVLDFASDIIRECGHVDIVVNNAGYAVYRTFEESPIGEIIDMLDVNLAGAMRCAKAFLPQLIRQRAGVIVNIGSIAGGLIITPSATYCAAKHGMVAWTRALRYELERFGVRVIAVCPGLTVTNFHRHPTFRRRERHRSKWRRGMSAATVSRAVIAALEADRVVTWVPRWQAFIVWAANCWPILFDPLWQLVSRNRIKKLYEEVGREEA
jgi:uncharacterized protein